MAERRYPTKIIPPNYEHIFERQRLFTLVASKKASELVWVNGVPGAGKTVFVISLLKHRGDDFLWYRIDAGSNHITDIFYFLGLAAHRNYPEKNFKLPVFTAEYTDDIENFARVFFRDLFSVLARESAVVLDNCQELEQDPKFFRLLQIAVDQLPQGLQLICISRNRPDVELGRLSLTGRLLEINDADLRFSDQEGEEFIHWIDPHLNSDQVAQIQWKAQGWAAAMVLLARQMTLSGRIDKSGTSKNSLDFLIPQILSSLPKPLHAFLTASAIFTQFTVDMSEELTAYHQAQADLEILVNKNLLIERTSGDNSGYRFHPLFRELLLLQAPVLYTGPEWQALQRKAALILVREDKIIEALPLYQQLQDWSTLRELLSQEAPKLIDTGRYRTLRQWLEALPVEYLESNAWLNYWYALTIKPSDPLRAESYLEKSYQQFIDAKDTKGIYSAWVDAVESIVVSWDDFSKLKVWMDRFDMIHKDFSAPSIELKIRFYATAIQALSIYNAQHPWLERMIKICVGIIHFVPVRKLRMLLSTQLGHYYLVTFQVAKMSSIVPLLESVLEDDSLPALIRIISAYTLVLHSLLTADTEKIFCYTHKGLELSELSGIELFKNILLTNLVGYHIEKHDLKAAEAALHTAIKFRSDGQRMVISLHHSYSMWLSALSGNLSYALEEANKSLQLSNLICMEAGFISTLSIKIQLLAELAQWQEAEQALDSLADLTGNSSNRLGQIFYQLAEAWLAYTQHDEDRMLVAVRELLQILRAESVFAFFGWRPNVLITLCLFAIENDIEQEFAILLLKKHLLLAAPPVHLEQWPWSVRIYSFGTFEIVVDSKSNEQSGKSQKKILELLEMLINFGGRDVHCDHLAGILWPDAEGDLARQTFETTLHRLRKLIGKDTVLLSNGLLSLNAQHCWLDLWAFEATAVELEQVLAVDKQLSIIDKLTDRLLKLYRGTFLRNNDSGSIILRQEQLLNKLSCLLDSVIDAHQVRGTPKRVLQLLHRQLELNPLVETNYRRLISHYANNGQQNEALQIYRQCQRILQGFNMRLSNDIELLAKQIEQRVR